MSTGTVTNVTEHTAGSELSTAAIATDTTLSVINVGEYDQDGGYLLIGDEQFAYTYTRPVDADGVDIAPEDGSGDLDLDGALVNPYDEGEPVYQVNSDGTLFVQRFAYVIEPGGEEELKLRVPHALFALLPLGARDEETAEQVTFAQDGTDYVVTDILGKVPGYERIRFPAGTTAGSPDSRSRPSVEWIRQADGTVVASVQGVYDEALTMAYLKLLARQPTPTSSDFREAVFGVGDSSGNAEAVIQCDWDGVNYMVQAIAVAQNVKLIDDTGDSDFEFATSGGWQDWTPTLTGWSANPASGIYRYKQESKKVTVQIRQPTDGTSNATTKTISLPVTAATITNMQWDGICSATDNGVALTTPSKAVVNSAGTTINFAKDYSTASGGWTNSGAHRIRTCHLIYEAA